MFFTFDHRKRHQTILLPNSPSLLRDLKFQARNQFKKNAYNSVTLSQLRQVVLS